MTGFERVLVLGCGYVGAAVAKLARERGYSVLAHVRSDTRTEALRAEGFGDREPAPHVDVVRFIADAYGVPMPPFVPLESVHESLRADRRVDAARALATSGITLRYPTYREGMAPAATGIRPRR